MKFLFWWRWCWDQWGQTPVCALLIAQFSKKGLKNAKVAKNGLFQVLCFWGKNQIFLAPYQRLWKFRKSAQIAENRRKIWKRRPKLICWSIMLKLFKPGRWCPCSSRPRKKNLQSRGKAWGCSSVEWPEAIFKDQLRRSFGLRMKGLGVVEEKRKGGRAKSGWSRTVFIVIFVFTPWKVRGSTPLFLFHSFTFTFCDFVFVIDSSLSFAVRLPPDEGPNSLEDLWKINITNSKFNSSIYCSKVVLLVVIQLWWARLSLLLVAAT